MIGQWEKRFTPSTPFLMTPSSGESIGLAALRIMQVFQANRSSTFVWRGFPRAKARAPFAHLRIRCAARERTCNDGKSEVRKSGECEMFLHSAKKGKSRVGSYHRPADWSTWSLPATWLSNPCN